MSEQEIGAWLAVIKQAIKDGDKAKLESTMKAISNKI